MMLGTIFFLGCSLAPISQYRYFINGQYRRIKYNDNKQGLYGSWETWEVMEFIISISRPGKSWTLSEAHGKSWKSSMLSENKKAKRFF